MFAKKKKDWFDTDMFGSSAPQPSAMDIAKSKEILLKDIEIFKKAKGHLAASITEIGELTKYLSDQKFEVSKKLSDLTITEGENIEAYSQFTLMDSLLIKVEDIQKMLAMLVRTTDQSVRIFELGYEGTTLGIKDDETKLS